MPQQPTAPETEHEHRGFVCTFSSGSACEAIERVLEQIQSRRPTHFARLMKRVAGFAPVPVEWKDSQTLQRALGGFKGPHPYDYRSPGWVYVVPGLSGDEAAAVLAHELGHAATTEDDFETRCNETDEEWASELCADSYAYRWGFGRAIARMRPHRGWMHHGPAPGTEYMDGGRRCRVTRSFHIRTIAPGGSS